MLLPQSRYQYPSLPGDPLAVKQYQLANGLRLYLSPNAVEPRIFTNIAVRAGSKQDPADTTGLAHYMEHLLFKGTSRLGALNWEEESKLLERIADLYETRRATADEGRREALYTEIDRLSSEAARLAAPNEYDKLVTAIGATDTNAYTWFDQTVFVNDIPANELERWMQLEAERFRMMALRLFHTELETVYEEFNISQDRDSRKASNALRRLLFPTHPYGSQTTLGSAQHLKNPSLRKIQAFFQTYYTPNNMAIVLAGDFDPDEAIRLAERYFGGYEARPAPPFRAAPQPHFTAPRQADVYGQESPFVEIAWRFPGAGSRESTWLHLLEGVFSNGQAGLFDLNLQQPQRLLDSEAWVWRYADYSVFGLFGQPRKGQSLEEVTRLLLEQVEVCRRGDFPDWLLEAVVREEKYDRLKALERNKDRVSMMSYAFLMGIPWSAVVNYIAELERVTKAELVDFARRRLTEGYAIVRKHQGPDPSVIKVKKPPITPVSLNRTGQSDFARRLLAQPAGRLQPVFVDFDAFIQSGELSPGLPFSYVHNPFSPTFRLDYIFDMGKNHDQELSIAMHYLEYLGASRYTAAQIQQELYRLGLSFESYSHDRHTYLTLSGLEESLEEGLALIEHLLANVQENPEALRNVVRDILSHRANAKKERSHVLQSALSSYARYGPRSPFTWRLPAATLERLSAGRLTEQIRDLTAYRHSVYYYGQRDANEVARLLRRHHRAPAALRPLPPETAFRQLATDAPRVLFLDFPIVQADVLLISRGTPHFNLEEHLMREWYNEYFGDGLSSIVFQDIREAKGLAYQTFAVYTSPRRRDKAHYLNAYLGTQPDKLDDALPAMLGIIDAMPVAPALAEQARQNLLIRIESERLFPSKIFWEARAAEAVGHRRDLAKDLYERLRSAQLSDLLQFQQQYVQGRHFTVALLGQRSHFDFRKLEKYGEVKEVTLEQVFGY